MLGGSRLKKAPQGTKVGARRETDLLSWFCSTVDGRDYSTDNFDYLNCYDKIPIFIRVDGDDGYFVNIWSNATSK